MPYLVLDARYKKVRLDGRMRDCAVLIAMGVRDEGRALAEMPVSPATQCAGLRAARGDAVEASSGRSSRLAMSATYSGVQIQLFQEHQLHRIPLALRLEHSEVDATGNLLLRIILAMPDNTVLAGTECPRRE